ncbi:hypothetical protein [Salmonella phage SD-1_S14]|nr:hypothetical protein [Salmonella phage SD-1_S14]
MGNYSDIITDVFTPKNLCIKVEEITNSKYNLPDTYQLTLVSQSPVEYIHGKNILNI